MGSIVWASCFLAPSDPIYGAFSDLGKMLRQGGMELIVFGPDGNYEDYLGFRHFSCPILVGEQGRAVAFWAASADLPMGAGAHSELIALDKAWGAPYSDEAAELYTLKAMAFWQHAFELMQPAAILTWGATLPISRLLLRLAQQRQRPAYIIERGPLEGTLMLSLSGQTALTSANTLPALVSPSFGDPHLADRWDAIAEYYGASEDRHYSGANQIPDEDQSRALEEGPQTRVLFLGTFDLGSGCAFSDPALGDAYAPWVNSSKEAARLVASALAQVAPHAALWIKPHPACQFTLEMEGEGPATIQDVSSLDVRYLIRASTVCITLASTTQMLALLEERPVVTLGNGFLMGRNIAYEVHQSDDLPSELQRALECKDWPQRLRAGQALLAAMFEHDLIGLRSDVPARLGLTEMATLLGRFAHYQPQDLPDPAQRIDNFAIFRAMAQHDVTQAASQAEQQMATLLRERDHAVREVEAWTDRCIRAERAFGETSHALKELMLEKEAAQREVGAWTERCARTEENLGTVSARLVEADRLASQLRSAKEAGDAALTEVQNRYSSIAEALQRDRDELAILLRRMPCLWTRSEWKMKIKHCLSNIRR